MFHTIIIIHYLYHKYSYLYHIIYIIFKIKIDDYRFLLSCRYVSVPSSPYSLGDAGNPLKDALGPVSDI